FGGKRLVWVRDAGGKNLAPAVAPLLAEPPSDAVVLIEAGDLRKGTGLRKDAEEAKAALAIWCPADNERDLARMIDEEAASLGLNVEPDARAMLLDRLGADRAASRAEVSKACLYAAGTGALTVDDVDAVVGDVSVNEMSAAVDAALLGRRQELDELLTKLLKQDSHAVQLLMNAQWAIQAFEPAAAAVAAGTSPQRAAEGMRPPLYGPRKVVGARVLEEWTPPMLRAAAHVVSEAIFRTRTMPALTGPVTRDALLRLVSQPRGPA
ncbi:MAG: DNA polymerase III subunit delta, partial [Pseudomonadota bacterium]